MEKLFVLFARDSWQRAHWYEVWGVFSSEKDARRYATRKGLKTGQIVREPEKGNVIHLPKREKHFIAEIDVGEIPEVEEAD